jgi:hypothetical protein
MMITLFNGARRVDIPGLKRVQSIDPLAKDPENHATPRGKNVAHFSSIVNDGRKTAQAEAKEYPQDGSKLKPGIIRVISMGCFIHGFLFNPHSLLSLDRDWI